MEHYSEYLMEPCAVLGLTNLTHDKAALFQVKCTTCVSTEQQ